MSRGSIHAMPGLVMTEYRQPSVRSEALKVAVGSIFGPGAQRKTRGVRVWANGKSSNQVVIEWGTLPNVGFQRSCKSEDLLRALSFVRPFDSSGKTPVSASAAFAMEIIIGQQLIVAEDGVEDKMQTALSQPQASAAAAAQSILTHMPQDTLQSCRFSSFNSEDQTITLVSSQGGTMQVSYSAAFWRVVMPQLLPALQHVVGAAAATTDTSREQQCPNITQHPTVGISAPAYNATQPSLDCSPSSDLLQDMSPTFLLNPTSVAPQCNLGPRLATSALKSQLQHHSSALEATAATSHTPGQVNGVSSHASSAKSESVAPEAAKSANSGAASVVEAEAGAAAPPDSTADKEAVASLAKHAEKGSKSASSRAARESSAPATRASTRRLTRSRAAAAANAMDTPTPKTIRSKRSAAAAAVPATAAALEKAVEAAAPAAEPTASAAHPTATSASKLAKDPVTDMHGSAPSTQEPATMTPTAGQHADTPMTDGSAAKSATEATPNSIQQPAEAQAVELACAATHAAPQSTPVRVVAHDVVHDAPQPDAESPAAEQEVQQQEIPANSPAACVAQSGDQTMAAETAPPEATAAAAAVEAPQTVVVAAATHDSSAAVVTEATVPITAHACGFPAEIPVWPGKRFHAVQRHARLTRQPRARMFAIWDTYMYTFDAGMPLADGPNAPGVDELPLYPPVQMARPQIAETAAASAPASGFVGCTQGWQQVANSVAPVQQQSAAAAHVPRQSDSTAVAAATPVATTAAAAGASTASVAAVQQAATPARDVPVPSDLCTASPPKFSAQLESDAPPAAAPQPAAADASTPEATPSAPANVTAAAPQQSAAAAVAAAPEPAPPLPTAESLQSTPVSAPEERKKIAIRPQMARKLVNTRKVITSAPVQISAIANGAVSEPAAARNQHAGDGAAAGNSQSQQQERSANGAAASAGTPSKAMFCSPVVQRNGGKADEEVDDEAGLYDDLEPAHRETPRKHAAAEATEQSSKQVQSSVFNRNSNSAVPEAKDASPRRSGGFPESPRPMQSTQSLGTGVKSPAMHASKAVAPTRSASPPLNTRRRSTPSPDRHSQRHAAPARRSPEYCDKRRSSPRRGSPNRSPPRRTSPPRTSPNRSPPRRTSPRRSSPHRSESPPGDAALRRSSSNTVPPSRRGWQRISVVGTIQDTNYVAVDESICARIRSNQDAPSCPEFRKTGWCSNAARCELRHDVGRIRFNLLGYPMRPGERACSFFLKYGNCKFRSKCYYSHPNIAPRSGPRAGQILINDDQQPTLDEAVRDRQVRHSERNSGSYNDRGKGRDWGTREGRYSPRRARGRDRDRDRDHDRERDFRDEPSEVGDAREAREGRDRDRDRDRVRDRPRFAAAAAAATANSERSRSRSRSPAPVSAALKRKGSGLGRPASASPPPSRPDRSTAKKLEAEGQQPSRRNKSHSHSRSRSVSRSSSPSPSRSPSIDRLVPSSHAASSPRHKSSDPGRPVAAPRTVEPDSELLNAERSIGGLRGSKDSRDHGAAQQPALPSVQEREGGGKSADVKGQQGGKHAAASMFNRNRPSPAPMGGKRKAPDESEEPNTAAAHHEKHDEQSAAKARADPQALERPAKAARMSGGQQSDDAEALLQQPWHPGSSSSDMFSMRGHLPSEAAATAQPSRQLQADANANASFSEQDDRRGRWGDKPDTPAAAPKGDFAGLPPPPPPRASSEMEAPAAAAAYSGPDVLGGVRGKAAGSTDRVTLSPRDCGAGAGHSAPSRAQAAVPASAAAPAVRSTERPSPHAHSLGTAAAAADKAAASNHAAGTVAFNGRMPANPDVPRTNTVLGDGRSVDGSGPLGRVQCTQSAAAAESRAVAPVATSSVGGGRWDRGPGGAVANPPLPPQSAEHGALACLPDTAAAAVASAAPDPPFPPLSGFLADHAGTAAVRLRLPDSLAQVPPLPEVAWLPEASRPELKQQWDSYCTTAHAQLRTAAAAVMKLQELSAHEQQALADVQVAVSRLTAVQQERDALQKALPDAAHAAITETPPEEFLQQCFQKAQQQFMRVTRSAAQDPKLDASAATASIAVSRERVEIGDSSVHLQNAVRVVQKHVYG